MSLEAFGIKLKASLQEQQTWLKHREERERERERERKRERGEGVWIERGGESVQISIPKPTLLFKLGKIFWCAAECVCECVCMYVCMYVYVCLCMCVCVCVCVRVC